MGRVKKTVFFLDFIQKEGRGGGGLVEYKFSLAKKKNFYWRAPWGSLQLGFAAKKKFFCILGYSMHISFCFLVGTTNGGVQYPHELIKYCLPHLCTMCFITFLAIYKCKVCFGEF